MKENYTHISVVLDRSGSMSSIASDTIGGFNTFLKTQKEAVGTCTFSLMQFDNEHTIIHDGVDINEVPDLDATTFVPRGGTALWDAIGRTIHATGAYLGKMKEADRPEKVVFVIITDGDENSSREFSHAKVREMIKHQTDKYQWGIIFLGAN